MAVVVQCFHCAHTLELDDGFRGGVCRCSRCGALLQVPKGDGSPVVRPPRPAAPTPRPDAKRGVGSGVDLGISSGRLDPRNAPPGSYRGAADPGFSSGRLAGQGLGKKAVGGPVGGLPATVAQAETVDAQVGVGGDVVEKGKGGGVWKWVVVGIVLVGGAVVAGMWLGVL